MLVALEPLEKLPPVNWAVVPTTPERIALDGAVNCAPPTVHPTVPDAREVTVLFPLEHTTAISDAFEREPAVCGPGHVVVLVLLLIVAPVL